MNTYEYIFIIYEYEFYFVAIHCWSQNVIISFQIKRNSAVITEEFQPGFDLLFFQIQISSNPMEVFCFWRLNVYVMNSLLSPSVLVSCKKIQICIFIYNFQFTFYFDLWTDSAMYDLLTPINKANF